MNPSEAAVLLGIAAAFDRRTVGEVDARAWAEALADVALDDARAAVVEHYRESARWLMPADVRTRVKAMRRARLEREVLPAPPAELCDDVKGYKAALDRRIAQIADGWSKGLALDAPKGQHRPTEAYRKARGEDARHDLRVASLHLPCPHCKAAPGAVCVNAVGKPLATEPAHEARLVAAGLARWTEVRGVRRAELIGSSS
ncbi:hypothetical protein OG320_05095 [Microbispora sp. NBC_01189]|uniref:zinc finger domain-containing protein n=1 Tax=Microbispora sp. NBC_01189 TaxID=2903583 RepID=UPI002E0F857C|nr:hypothetical protein OG320_05095 [Microbispora sp. NBC_01189]